MKFYFFAITVFLCLHAGAQGTDTIKPKPGIKFTTEPGWAAVLKKAKQEGKYIFIDAWTTWCYPCRVMNKTVFPDKETGDFYNKNFISIKMQMDSTATDTKTVKDWYADAHAIMKKYNVKLFPTFLFFDPNGTLVHKGIGGSDVNSFIALGRESLDPTQQFYTLKKQYEAGRRETKLLFALANGAWRAAEDDFARKVSKEYLSTQDNLFTRGNLLLLRSSITKSSDSNFSFFVTHRIKIDSVLGKGQSALFFREFIKSDFLYKTLYNLGQPIQNIDWKGVETVLQSVHPDLPKLILYPLMISHNLELKDEKLVATAIRKGLQEYPQSIEDDMVITAAAFLFHKSEEESLIRSAVSWVERLLSKSQPADEKALVLYASLLYKYGQKVTASIIMQYTLTLPNGDTADARLLLEKMRKDEKIWDVSKANNLVFGH